MYEACSVAVSHRTRPAGINDSRGILRANVRTKIKTQEHHPDGKTTFRI